MLKASPSHCLELGKLCLHHANRSPELSWWLGNRVLGPAFRVYAQFRDKGSCLENFGCKARLGRRA